MSRGKKTTLQRNWSEEELQRAFDERKFSNCSVSVVSKEHGIPSQTLRDYLIFPLIKTFQFLWSALLPTGWRYTNRVALLSTYPLALLRSRAFHNANHPHLPYF